MLLRVEETVNLEFESIDIIPGESSCSLFLSMPTFHLKITGQYFDVKLKTRKSAQTGVLHSWRLFANDIDPKICPVRMMILLARLYPANVKLKGPLFLKVSKQGAVLPEFMVSTILFDLVFLSFRS